MYRTLLIASWFGIFGVGFATRSTADENSSSNNPATVRSGTWNDRLKDYRRTVAGDTGDDATGSFKPARNFNPNPGSTGSTTPTRSNSPNSQSSTKVIDISEFSSATASDAPNSSLNTNGPSSRRNAVNESSKVLGVKPNRLEPPTQDTTALPSLKRDETAKSFAPRNSTSIADRASDLPSTTSNRSLDAQAKNSTSGKSEIAPPANINPPASSVLTPIVKNNLETRPQSPVSVLHRPNSLQDRVTAIREGADREIPAKPVAKVEKSTTAVAEAAPVKSTNEKTTGSAIVPSVTTLPRQSVESTAVTTPSKDWKPSEVIGQNPQPTESNSADTAQKSNAVAETSTTGKQTTQSSEVTNTRDQVVPQAPWVTQDLGPSSRRTTPSTIEVPKPDEPAPVSTPNSVAEKSATKLPAEYLDPKSKLTIALSGPQDVVLGQTMVYRLTLSNTSTSDAEHVVIQLLPMHDKDPGTTSNFGKLAAGETKTLELELVANQLGNLKIRAQIQADGGLQASTVHEVVVQRDAGQNPGQLAGQSLKVNSFVNQAELKLEVIDPQGALTVGKELVYEIHLKNQGTATAHQIDIRGMFSRGIEPTLAAGAEYGIADGAVNFAPISSLKPGQELVLKIRAQAAQAGRHKFRAEAFCNEIADTVAVEHTKSYLADPNGNGAELTARRPGANSPH